MKIIGLILIYLFNTQSVNAIENSASIKVNTSFTYEQSDVEYSEHLKRLKPILKQLNPKQNINNVGVIYVTYSYSIDNLSNFTTSNSDLPPPPPNPQIGMVVKREYCSGNRRVELVQEYRYTSDTNGDGKNDSNPQWITTGFREIAAESDLCKGLDL